MEKKCIICGYTNSHPFGFSFKGENCMGCITHQEKYKLDWDNRLLRLKEIIKETKSSSVYDCVIPVVGDAEDYYVVSEVLKLKINPLLVSVNSYFLNDIGWQNLHNLITYFDLDSVVYNPDINTYKELIRTSLRKYKHALLPFHQLHTSFPVHIAKDRGIPLVIWGGNQSVEQVGKFSHLDEVEMTKWSRKEHDLFNIEIDTLIGNGAQVNERHLSYYNYPKIKNLGKKVRGIYLSNYLRWDPLKQNQSTINFGFQPELNNSTFDIYERAGSSVYYSIHDLLKFERHGYRKINDHVVREIRHKRITSSDGNKILLKKSDQKVFIKPFFDWLGVTNTGYQWYIDHMLVKSNQLVSNEKVPIDTTSDYLPPTILNCLVESQKSKEEFIIFGKGVHIR